MGKLNIVISDELEKRFRQTVALRWGARKGAISSSIEEAIESWIKLNTKSKDKIQGRTKLIW